MWYWHVVWEGLYGNTEMRYLRKFMQQNGMYFVIMLHYFVFSSELDALKSIAYDMECEDGAIVNLSNCKSGKDI